MKNPLSSKYSEEENQRLVKQALEGDQSALDQLIRLHQPFIYNVAWKMAHDPNDALDLTQEVLIKVITKLSQFNFNSSFRTWLYRIVTNEFLQTKRRQGEQQFSSLDEYGARLDSIPNPDLTREEEITYQELSKEMQIRCMSGMLMCLNREQRLIYILGDTFGVDHKIGAEIFNVSPQNFRIKLHRARKDLYNFMNNKCGLVNKSNPCRCPKKTKALIPMGLLDANNMQFNISEKNRIEDYVEEEHMNLMDSIEDKYVALFRQHPTREDFGEKTVIREILEDEDIMKYLE
ncbi:RNA polymerase sigma factor [Tunicatimonas pelagia]|uniref:RNA polymerase sigma factor n=1 Tax=Tunicatimonas pelagia TaxID=931531 RepID=UPI002665F529|nr:RNA polymerase sigma factor [Tunicatimonas pelagia]WKN44744.1 RNA polymerase sigma factor [Tunicatimonas pelagia]